jgi:tetratricopeptide (TPR) repeat protein
VIGRDVQLQHFRQALTSTMAGHGVVVPLVGDAGVGKTHLATMLAREAEQAGCAVAWGRCSESEGAPGYWPWTQVLAAVERAFPDARVARILSDASPGAPLASLAESRVEVFFRVGGALLDLARQRPLALVFDDLHWADAASLRLLEVLARDASTAPLLLVATWRDGEVRNRPEHEAILADIGRAGRSLLLGGLAEPDVEALLRAQLGPRMDPDLPAAVTALTSGNPFFVLEVAALLARAGGFRAADLPQLPSSAGVRGMLRQRFATLPVPTVDVVRIAAVLGREFDLTTLAAMLESGINDVSARIAAAERLGLVRALPETLRRYAFSHALVRDVLYDSIPSTDRAALHRRASDAIVATVGPSLDAVLTTVSYHQFEAARGGDARGAATWSMRAGTHALRQLAFEEAVVCFERALQTLNCLAAVLPAERADALMGLAERAVATAADAMAAAQGTDPTTCATAALRQANVRNEFGLLDVVAIAALETALQRLPPDDAPLRARVMARLAAGLQLQPGAEARRHALADAAVQMADRVADPATRIVVYTHRTVALFGPDTLDDRLAGVDEIVALAETSGDRSAALPALAYGVHDLLELGDRMALERRIAECERLATDQRTPLGRWLVASFRTMLALMEGRWADADRLASAALAIGQQAQLRSALLHYGQHLISLRGEAGRIAEVIPLVEMASAEASTVPAWHCTLADLYMVAGRRDDAVREYESLAARGFDDIPRDTNWLVAASLIGGVCADLQDRPRARVLYGLLSPYRDLVAAARPAVVGLSPVALVLGRLAAVLGEWEDAGLQFERAVIIAERMGARPWAARARVHWAEMLARSGDPTAKASGRDILNAARVVAESLEMHELLGRMPAIAGQLGPVPDDQPQALEVPRLAAVGDPSSPTAMPSRSRNVVPLARRGETPRPTLVPRRTRLFRRDGDVWTLGWSEHSFPARHAVGLVYIAHLLARPREEVHVNDLVRLASSPRTTAAPPLDDGLGIAADLGSSGPHLDPVAKEQYRRRLVDLDREFDEADANHDLGRVEALLAEREFLQAELRRSLGLGGSDRHASSSTERARVAVAKAIRYALRKIAAQDAQFADELDLAIRTGTFCVYVGPISETTPWVL